MSSSGSAPNCACIWTAGGNTTAVLLPFDGLFEVRVAAALRLWRAVNGRRPGPNPAALSEARRNRLILALRALDGRLTVHPPRNCCRSVWRRCCSERDWISHDSATARRAWCVSVSQRPTAAIDGCPASLSRPFVSGRVGRSRRIARSPYFGPSVVRHRAPRRPPLFGGSDRITEVPLPANFPDLPPRYLRTPEAAVRRPVHSNAGEASYLRHRPSLFEARRTRGLPRRDLQAWVEWGQGVDVGPGTATVLPAKRQAIGLPAARRFGPALTHVSAAPSPPNANSSSSSGRCRRPRPARCAGPHGLSLLQPGQNAPHAPIDFRMNDVAIRVEAVAEHGMATIWDADVLIWAASQIVEARDAGLCTSRLMAARPCEILTFTGRGTSARDYHRVDGDSRVHWCRGR